MRISGAEEESHSLSLLDGVRRYKLGFSFLITLFVIVLVTVGILDVCFCVLELDFALYICLLLLMPTSQPLNRFQNKPIAYFVPRG